MRKYYVASILGYLILFFLCVYTVYMPLKLEYLFFGLLIMIDHVILWFFIRYLYAQNISKKKGKIALFFVGVLICTAICWLAVGFWLEHDSFKAAVQVGISAVAVYYPWIFIPMAVSVGVRVAIEKVKIRRQDEKVSDHDIH